jgi:hypothetical protein
MNVTEKIKGYTLNLPARTLTITKAFEEAVSLGHGDEFDIYTKLHREIPGLVDIRKTHKTPTKYRTRDGETYNCNQFKNLKYENMEGFINGLPNNEEFIRAYNFLKYCGSLVSTTRYTAVRKWFVAQFPEFRKNPLFYLYNTPDLIDFEAIVEEIQMNTQEKAEKKSA